MNIVLYPVSQNLILRDPLAIVSELTVTLTESESFNPTNIYGRGIINTQLIESDLLNGTGKGRAIITSQLIESDLLNGTVKGRMPGRSSLSEQEILTANLRGLARLIANCYEQETLDAQIKGRVNLTGRFSEVEILEGLIRALRIRTYSASGFQFKIIHENPKAFTITKIEN
jgi:hypothetical protein